MLEHLGAEACACHRRGVDRVLAEPMLRMRDLGSSAGMQACAKAVAQALD
jgi:hypothetical protein